jgi:hypothetical protein
MNRNVDWDAVPLTRISLILGFLALVCFFIAAIVAGNI